MNYFAHFFVDHKLNQHEFNTGLFLPDVARGFVKTFKTSLPDNSNQCNVGFWEGCQTHYVADKKFHGSTFFQELLSISTQVTNNAAFTKELNRKWFLAHIMAEVMLDRILIKESPMVLDSFYHTLDTVADADLINYLTVFNCSDTNTFMEHFNHFRKVKYIYYYTDNNKFVYSLNRIMIRAGVGAITENNQQVLLNVVDELEFNIVNKYKNVGEHLKLEQQV